MNFTHSSRGIGNAYLRPVYIYIKKVKRNVRNDVLNRLSRVTSLQRGGGALDLL